MTILNNVNNSKVIITGSKYYSCVLFRLFSSLSILTYLIPPLHNKNEFCNSDEIASLNLLSSYQYFIFQI